MWSDIDMIVDLKAHVLVEIVHYKGRQGSNIRARESLFLPEFAKVFFLAKDLANDFKMRPQRKIHESRYLFIREEWPSADKGI